MLIILRCVPFGNNISRARIIKCSISISSVRINRRRIKVRNILIVLAVLFATFLYPVITLWLVPSVISLMTLSKFRKNEMAKYIGLLSLKPIFVWFLFLLVADFNFFERLSAPYSFAIVPELILTTVIVYFFRNLFRSHKLAWIFFIADIVRWLTIFIESLLPDPVPEPYFYPQFYVLVLFLLVFPSLYAIVGFLAVSKNVPEETGVDEKKAPSPSV